MIVFGIPFEFIFFALTLTGVAIFHNHTLKVALTGLLVISAFKFFYTDFSFAEHFIGTSSHHGEWNILLNLFGLLTGFALLANHFEQSNFPQSLPKYLPEGWKGGFILLLIVFILSALLDNIAAAIIGGSIAHIVYKNKVHIGFLAAIVAASNAGGAGSVLGDTTTTMMWIDGVSAVDVLHATVGSVAAFLFFSLIASRQQHSFEPILKDNPAHPPVDMGRIIIVILILLGAIFTNIYLEFPAAGVWAIILIGSFFRKTAWGELPGSIKGSLFLLALVASASMMPVSELPEASWQTAFVLGFVSSVFDNIPLTKLALEQGGYDWGMLAYAVGFGGSMIWFGSSAGVAISNMYPQTKSVFEWVKKGWHVAIAYIIGFFMLLWTLGWNPHEPYKEQKETHTTSPVH